MIRSQPDRRGWKPAKAEAEAHAAVSADEWGGLVKAVLLRALPRRYLLLPLRPRQQRPSLRWRVWTRCGLRLHGKSQRMNLRVHLHLPAFPQP